MVEAYLVASPSYFGGNLAFGWASESVNADNVNPGKLAQRYAASGIQTRYYTADAHRAAFALPSYETGMRNSEGTT